MKLETYVPEDMRRAVKALRPVAFRKGRPIWPISGGARQYLQDGPFIDPPVANSGNLTSTSIEDMWTGTTYTPIFANDPKAGKIYVVEAGGTLTTSASAGTTLITPLYGTGGVALGASGAQTSAASITAGPWYLRFVLVFRVIGAAGLNSTCIGTGIFCHSGTLATAGSGTTIPFGGTSASVDATLNKDLTFRKTISQANTMIVQYAYISSVN